MKNHQKPSKRVEVLVGKSVSIIRKFQKLSLNDLSTITGIPRSTLSAIEHNRMKLGVERTKVIARALKCHPAVLVFSAWNIKESEIA